MNAKTTVNDNKSGFELITPDMARTYLERNARNRPVTKNTVETYAQAMRQGKWRRTHQGIAFGADGNLYDGQHRLSAIVMANVPVNLLVTRGLPPEAREEIDTGRRRTANDNLAIVAGVNLPVMLSSALNVIWMAENDIRTRNAHSGELQDLLMRHLNGVEMAQGVFTSPRKGVSRSGFVAGFIYAHATDPARVTVMAQNFYEGTNLTSGDPMFTLREYAITSRPGSGRTDTLMDMRRALGMISGELDGEKRLKVQASLKTPFNNSRLYSRFIATHRNATL